MNNLFPILAIETTDRLCSVAILLNEEDYFESNIQGKHIHSQKLVVMIDEILNSAELTFPDIKCLAISEGPGSFTGLRIGMAAAKGIAVGADLPMILVPTFSALAFKLSAHLKKDRIFSIIKKASKDENYFAEYIVTEENFRELVTLQLVKSEKLSSMIEDDVIIYSNIEQDNQNSELTVPTAKDIGRWAYKFGKDLLTSNYDLIEPKYLKEFLVRTQK